jgi:hypothetical protein
MRTLVSARKTYLLVMAMVAVLSAVVVLMVSPTSGATASTTDTLMETCQDTYKICAIYPGGSWNEVRSGKASGGTYHVSRSTTRPAVFRAAVGPEIDLVTDTGPKRGTAKVKVYDLCDDVVAKVVKFNLRTANPHHKVVKRITGLRQDRMYAVAVVSANGKPVVVDAYKGTPVSAVDHVDHHPGAMKL